MNTKRDRGREWSRPFPPTKNGQGFDSYWHLEDRPLTCNAVVELQAIETRTDDAGEYMVYLDRGVRVSYELGWNGAQRVPILIADVGGHRATLFVDPWMRFRWLTP